MDEKKTGENRVPGILISFFLLFLWIFFLPSSLSATDFAVATGSSSVDASAIIDVVNSFGTDEFVFAVTPSPSTDDYELKIAIWDDSNNLVNHFYSGTITTDGQHTITLNWDGVGDHDLDAETEYTDNNSTYLLATGTYRAQLVMNEKLIYDYNVGFGRAFYAPVDPDLDDNGAFYVVNKSDGTVHILTSAGDLTSRFGSEDLWYQPEGIAVDNQSTQGIYISATQGNSIDGDDSSVSTTVRKCTLSNGEWEVDTTFETNLLAGFTFRSGAKGPKGLCVNEDTSGTEYLWITGISDADGKGCLVKVALDGTVQWSESAGDLINSYAVDVIVESGVTNIFLARDDSRIYKFHENAARTGLENGNARDTRYALSGALRSVSVDANYIYATDQAGDRIFAWDRTAGAAVTDWDTNIEQSHRATPLGDDNDWKAPWGICVDRGRSRIWVADTGTGPTIPNYSIYKYDIIASTGLASFTARIQTDDFALGEPNQVFVDQNSGNWYVADSRFGVAKCFDPYGSYRTVYNAASWTSGAFTNVRGVAVDSSGIVYVGDEDTGEVIRFNNSGGAPIDTYSTVFVSGFLKIWQLWVENYNGQDYLFVACQSRKKIHCYDISQGPGQSAITDDILALSAGNQTTGLCISPEKYLIVVDDNSGIYKYRHTKGNAPSSANFTSVSFEDGTLPGGELQAVATDFFGDLWLADNTYTSGGGQVGGAIWKAGNDGDQTAQKTSDSVTGKELIRGPDATTPYDMVKFGYSSPDLGKNDGQVSAVNGIAVYPSNSYSLPVAGSYNPKYVYISEAGNGRVTRFRVEADAVETFYLTLGNKASVASPTVGGFEVVGYEDLHPYVLSEKGNTYTIRVHFTRNDMDTTAGQGTVVLNTASAVDHDITFSKWIGSQIWEGTVDIPTGDDGLADIKIKNFKRSGSNHWVGTSPDFTRVLNDVIDISTLAPSIQLLTLDGDGLSAPSTENVTDQSIVSIAGTTSPGEVSVTVFNYDDETSTSSLNLLDSQSLFSDGSGDFTATNISLNMGYNYITASASDEAGNDSGLIAPRYIVKRVAKLPGILGLNPTDDAQLGELGSWTLTYTASADIGSRSNNLGLAEYVELEVPVGWSNPTVSEGIRGYIKVYPSIVDVGKVDLATETLQSPGTYSIGIDGQKIKVYFDYIQSGQGFSLIYGDPSDDNPPSNSPADIKVGDPENQVILGQNNFTGILWIASGTDTSDAVLASSSLAPPSINVYPRDAMVSVENRVDVSAKFVDTVTTNGAYDDGEKIFLDPDDDFVGWASETYKVGSSGDPDSSNITLFPTDDLTSSSVSTVYYDTDADGQYDNGEPIILDSNNDKKFNASDTEISNSGIVSTGDGLKAFSASILAGQGDNELLKLTLKNPNTNTPLVLRGLYLHVRDESGSALDPDDLFEKIEAMDNGENVFRIENAPFTKTGEALYINLTDNAASVTFTNSSDGIVRIIGSLKSTVSGGTVFHVGFESDDDFQIRDADLLVDAPVSLDTGMSYGTATGSMRSYNQVVHRYSRATELAIAYESFWETGVTALSKGQTGAKNFSFDFRQPIAGEGEIEITRIILGIQASDTLPALSPVGIAPDTVFCKVSAAPLIGSPYKVITTDIETVPSSITIDLSAKPITVTNEATETVEITLDIATYSTMPNYVRSNIFSTVQVTARDRLTLDSIATFTGPGSNYPYNAIGSGFARIWNTASLTNYKIEVTATGGIDVIATATSISGIIGDPIKVQLTVQHQANTATAVFDTSESNPVDLYIYNQDTSSDITSEFKITSLTRPSFVGGGGIATFIYQLEQIYGASAGLLEIDTAQDSSHGPIAYDLNDSSDSDRLTVTDLDGAQITETRLTVAKAQVDIFPLNITPRNDTEDPPLAPAADDAVVASESEVLVLAFYAIKNNGTASSFTSLVFKQTGTLEDAQVDLVKLWRDSGGASGDKSFDSAVDDLIATGTLNSGQLSFDNFISPYGTLVNNASVAFFISVDIASSSANRMDGKTLNGEIPVNGTTFDNGYRTETYAVTSMSTSTHIINIIASKLSLVPKTNTAATNSTKSIDIEAQDEHGNRDYESTENLQLVLSESISTPSTTASFTASTLANPNNSFPNTNFNAELVSGAGQISVTDETLAAEYVYASITSAFPFASGSIYYQSVEG
ncbi:hypothetical protein ACFL35_08770, partial [Candidatus Riflebacteria bacterium]